MSISLENFDRRDDTRRIQSIGARIVDAGGYVIGACTVCNLSRSGALLRAVGGVNVSGVMGLLLDGEESVRQFEIAWRSGSHAGIRFVAAAAPDTSLLSDLLSRAAARAGWTSSAG